MGTEHRKTRRELMLERTIEEYFKKQVEQAGGAVRKCVFPGHRGAPDRVVYWPGRLHWVELKRPKTPKPEPHQLREHARLRAAGQSVFVIASKAEVDEYVERMRVE